MNYFLGIDATSGVLVADFEDAADGANHPVAGTTVVTSNVWHHAAAVYDTTTDTWRLYLDGVLDRTLALGGSFTPRVDEHPARRHRQRAHLAPARPQASSPGRSTRRGSGTSPRSGAQIQAARMSQRDH